VYGHVTTSNMSSYHCLCVKIWSLPYSKISCSQMILIPLS